MFNSHRWNNRKSHKGRYRALLACMQSKYDNDGPTMAHMDTKCWQWFGGRNYFGYGTITWQAQTRNATRVIKGIKRLTASDCVLHRCDNPSCVRPSHMFIGTHADNMEDMKRKRRSRGKREQRGEANTTAKLTEAAVIEIRKSSMCGMKRRELAARFGVCDTTIGMILARKSWTHV